MQQGRAKALDSPRPKSATHKRADEQAFTLQGKPCHRLQRAGAVATPAGHVQASPGDSDAQQPQPRQLRNTAALGMAGALERFKGPGRC